MHWALHLGARCGHYCGRAVWLTASGCLPDSCLSCSTPLAPGARWKIDDSRPDKIFHRTCCRLAEFFCGWAIRSWSNDNEPNFCASWCSSGATSPAAARLRARLYRFSSYRWRHRRLTDRGQQDTRALRFTCDHRSEWHLIWMKDTNIYIDRLQWDSSGGKTTGEI